MVRFEFTDEETPAQDMEHIRVSDAEIVGLMSCQHTVGYWRADLETGHVFWSSDIFTIFGLPFTKGPVDLPLANATVHPDDLPYMLELFERLAVDKTGFHYVLRLKNDQGGHKFVRTVGRFRIADDGREELYGMVEEVFDHVRTVGIMTKPSTG
ncbi:PAS domain-containing protein [Hoeflea sp. IMCC20628]|uniref:PAS domain-containing protein n=1 Tax=Hoeflea sp. IMCC20628 TaxID=1620421 RepID=UPI00063BE01A|nr:PAS domain-containing protein [Hoeflea sp. IMCC20628]AKH99332.1 PAS domain-containing protein [Hoeflea sp. IMCC20628]